MALEHSKNLSETLSARGDEWDDCDQPLQHSATHSHLKPSTAHILHFTSIDGVKSGLVKQDPAVNASLIPSDVDYQIQLDREADPRPLVSDFVPYSQNEEQILPLSFKLAANNCLSREQACQYQQNDALLPFFFYGAQMFPSIVLATSGMKKSMKDIVEDMTPGLVLGFERLALKGRGYPTAVKSPHASAAINGMLVFGIPNISWPSFERFKAKGSELHKVRVIFKLNDGRKCSTTAAMYVQKDENDFLLIPKEEKTWRVSDLMADEWHLRNLKLYEAQEAGLEASRSSSSHSIPSRVR